MNTSPLPLFFWHCVKCEMFLSPSLLSIAPFGSFIANRIYVRQGERGSDVYGQSACTILLFIHAFISNEEVEMGETERGEREGARLFTPATSLLERC
jgi:hypothetical protein